MASATAARIKKKAPMRLIDWNLFFKPEKVFIIFRKKAGNAKSFSREGINLVQLGISFIIECSWRKNDEILDDYDV